MRALNPSSQHSQGGAAGSTLPAATSESPRRSRARWWALGALVLIVAGVAAGVWLRKQRNAVVRVTIERAAVKTIVQSVSATGKVQPEVEVKIAPEVSGEIVKLGFREGADVKKGDLLVAIKPDFYQAQVEQQEANLAAAKASSVQAKAQLVKAEEDLARVADLARKALVSESDLTSARTTLEVAQASYDNALAQIRRTEGSLNQARDQLTKTMIYSPINGKVSSLSTEVGERVAGTGSYGGAEIMRVADLNAMEVRVNVNENDIVNVKPGDRAQITIDAFPNRKFAGVVKEIGSAPKVQGQNTQDEVTNFLVKIRIVDKDAPLRPSMSANAEIETKTAEHVVSAPIQSVTVRSKEGGRTLDDMAKQRQQKAAERKGDGGTLAINASEQKRTERADRENMQRGVFVFQGEKVAWRPVETGIQDTTHIEIKSGLMEGETVVSGSYGVIVRTLKDGMAVKLEEPKKPAAKR